MVECYGISCDEAWHLDLRLFWSMHRDIPRRTSARIHEQAIGILAAFDEKLRKRTMEGSLPPKLEGVVARVPVDPAAYDEENDMLMQWLSNRTKR